MDSQINENDTIRLKAMADSVNGQAGDELR